MKFKIILILLIVSIALLSCRNKEITTEPKVIDLSSFGSVNMIKEIGGEIFVLNSTASSIHKLYGDSLSLFRDLEIGGRDFLLDFDIEGDKVYYSNTYDEIFISSGASIEDTIKVFNPDRIAVIDSLLYVTSRKAEDENVLLKLYNIKSKKEINCIPLNDSPVTEMKFAQVTICGSDDELWIINPFRSRMEQYDTDLNLLDSISLPNDKQYGNFIFKDNIVRILCSETKTGILMITRNSKASDTNIEWFKNENIDIRTSCVRMNRIILYDFIEMKLILN